MHAHVTSAGKPLESIVTPAYLDARVFVLYDGTIALFVAEWCGLEPIDG